MGLALGLVTNDLISLPQTKVTGRLHAENLRRANSMATSPNEVEWNLLGRITDTLLSQFLACQQEISGVC
jgi:hypothetical protein